MRIQRTDAKVRIESLRKRMVELYMQSGSLTSAQVVKASQELDEALNDFNCGI
ncbi:aspartyl-phosphate phosphatase Spo0E family protein [Paenibacillus harenae]|uniref:aspartyl-phosphate phosphatase Spo0E family protein n=1 Tax=Paenibacillus harenae TaxID=306543 RepID=UPI00278F3E1E|nr:aspartyl-phosphate phosphatase Spo0E family protein [Paenibacillus harenae]MDQ0061249.1 hypothetical protein [Paenibacillus harenae]